MNCPDCGKEIQMKGTGCACDEIEDAMANAPKDGTDILAWDGDSRVWRPIHWTGWGGGCWRCSASGYNIVGKYFGAWKAMLPAPEGM